MADTKIADLTTLTPVADGDWVAVVDISDTTDSADGTTKKAAKSEFKGDTGATGATGAAGADGADAYVYVAYASDASGTDFTTTFDAALNYIAIRATTTEIVSPAAGDFAGLWKNYKGATGATGATGAAGATGAQGPAGTGSGDMLAATYDPQNKAADAFSTDNHTDGTTNKVFSATEKTKLAGIETAADVTDAGNVGSSIDGATAKTTPVDADTMPLIDSAASNVLKKVTWANIKATLKTYFDTLYAAALGADDNYVTDAEKVIIGNTSGTNSGDNATNSQYSGLAGSKADVASPTFTGTVTLPVALTGVIRADTGVVSVDTDVTDIVAAASSTAAGKVELATDAETVTGTDTARATTPANITAKMAAPGAIGGTTAAAGTFTTLTTTANIELGHASDTTISRVSAGVIAVEGVNVLTTAGGTLTGTLNLGEGADPATIGIVMDSSMSADERYSGITIPATAGATLAFGDICYLDVTATEWLLADASAVGTAGNVVLGICVDASTDGNATSMLLLGTVRSAAFPGSIALGAPLYVSETAGDITATAPTTTDSVMRRVGFAVTAEPNTIYFNPSNDYVTHT